MEYTKVAFVVYFNSQPHEEADVRKLLQQVYVFYFNSQPHEEADEIAQSQKGWWKLISTHSLTKRLTSMLRHWMICIRHFNSQPHEEADSGYGY